MSLSRTVQTQENEVKTEEKNNVEKNNSYYQQANTSFQSFWNKNKTNKAIVIGSALATAATVTVAAVKMRK